MPERVLVNLLSDQRLPSFIATMQLCPDRVEALATDQFRKDVALFEELTGTPHHASAFAPYALSQDVEVVRRVLDGVPPGDEVIVNFTGGTKIMALAVVLPCLARRGANVSLIYVDTRNDRLDKITMTPEGKLHISEEPLSVVIPFPAVVALAGEKLKSLQCNLLAHQTERADLSKRLAFSRQLAGLFKKQKQFFAAGPTGRQSPKASGEVTFSSAGRKPGRPSVNACVRWDATAFRLLVPPRDEERFEHPDGAEYFAGKWLEEFTARELSESRLFDSVAQSAVLSLQPETLAQFQKPPMHTDKNELDVVVTKGTRAALIECKAGNATQDHVYKLAALTNHLLGAFGRAALVCRFRPSPGVIEKCRDLRVDVIAGSEDLRHIPARIGRLLRS